MSKSVSVILLNYNTISFTEQCIKSVISNTAIDYEIIVVENNSNDKAEIKKLENLSESIRVLISENNRGFGAGNNLGVKYAQGEYIVILNNDTIVYPNTIDNIKYILEKSEKNTVITGFIEDPDGGYQHSGGNELRFFAEVLRFGLLLIKYIPNKYYDNYYFVPNENSVQKNIDWASGCFFALTKKFYDELSGFDENMFMYVEDVEFHKRVRLNGGKIFFRPEIKIKHFGSQTSKNYKDTILKSQFRNTVYYFDKHSSKVIVKLFYFISKSIFLFWYAFFSFWGFVLFGNQKINAKKRIYKSLSTV
jgi:GT2 family glycosyltransferase